jgi:hypothetical protein
MLSAPAKTVIAQTETKNIIICRVKQIVVFVFNLFPPPSNEVSKVVLGIGIWVEHYSLSIVIAQQFDKKVRFFFQDAVDLMSAQAFRHVDACGVRLVYIAGIGISSVSTTAADFTVLADSAFTF